MLILTEKPSVAKDFAAALFCSFASGVYKNAGKNITITNCIGHLFALEEPAHYGTEIPIIPERFDYLINPAAEKQARLVIKTLQAHKSDSILIATDADREGEIIARECLAEAGITDFSRIKRFWVSQALTKEVIQEGIRNAKPLAEYNALSAQGFARQRADWLCGMNFSRYITRSANRKLSVGRVQTAILSAIEERCNTIYNFKSEKYFEHYGVFRPTCVGSDPHSGAKPVRQVLSESPSSCAAKAYGSSVSCKGIYFDGDKTAFADDSRDIKLRACVGEKATLIDSKTEKKTQNPPQLYNLNALQKDAFKYFGYSADKTLKIVQSLYEDLKCVSYPRTPSRVMGSGNVELCKKVAEDLADSYPFFSDVAKQMEISPQNKRCFNDAKLEAHHALIPLKGMWQFELPDQRNIYHLILERFFTAFLPPHEYEKMTFILGVNENKFKITGKKTTKDGWKSSEVEKVFTPIHTDRHVSVEDDTESDDEQTLESIDWNNLVLSDVETKEKWTKPPAFFNEASILAFMENPKADRRMTAEDEQPKKKLVGLGTPATRHTFIPKLTKCGYITLEKKSIVTTEVGRTLLRAVRSSPIKSLADIAATTDWEKRLEENPALFLSDIKTFVRNSVTQKMDIAVPESASGITCPFCHKEVRRGKSNWYCTGYKDGCNFKLWESVAGAKLTEKDVAALCNGKQTGIKHCTSKAGKAFDCRFKLNAQGAVEFVFEEKRGK
ncbi:MAG: DNA topoisomerase [Treponema sp.]|uniref:type IA DNA topoisomerase n=1 Tax=Treponema sp. TaxID=166 RepID=UPI0025E76F3A|nr:type IA DNA topoisomerase [Treponema sp.]MBQ8678354.1 DNA topoisomerase [Treponema sp.]